MALAREQGWRVLRGSDQGVRASRASRDARHARHVRHMRQVNGGCASDTKRGAARAAHVLTLQ